MLAVEIQDPSPRGVEAKNRNKRSKPITAVSDPFVFVPISGQEAAKGRAAAKRIVRAHVTRVQHERNGNFSVGQDLQRYGLQIISNALMLMVS